MVFENDGQCFFVFMAYSFYRLKDRDISPRIGSRRADSPSFLRYFDLISVFPTNLAISFSAFIRAKIVFFLESYAANGAIFTSASINDSKRLA